MPGRPSAGFLVASLFGLCGCVATQRDILELEAQTDELKQTVASLQANQADLSVQMKQLHEDLTAFIEIMKQSSDRMSELSSKLDDLSVGVASKVASIGTALTAQQAKSMEEQKTALANAAAPPSELFNAADVRLSLKNYSLAAKGFEEYLAKFPKGSLADVAAYKLGQAYYGEKKWEPAGRQFAIVLDKYPKSELTPSARLLYALCLLKLNKNTGEARQYLESVVSDFPKSPEAKAAAQHLKKLSSPEASPKH